MRHLVPRLGFVSAELSRLGLRRNVERDLELRELIGDRPHFRVSGHYGGHSEQSYALFDVDLAFALAKQFDQECILIREVDGSCYLKYCYCGSEEFMGRWSECTSRPEGDHSEIDGRYFQVIR